MWKSFSTNLKLVVVGLILFFGYVIYKKTSTVTPASVSNVKSRQTESVSDSVSTTNKVANVALVYNIKPLLNRSMKEVEKILGKAESKSKINGYPCKYSRCTKVIYKNGKYEVIFKNGKTSRIIVNSFPDYTNTQDAIQSIGFPKSSPSFLNPGIVARWSTIEGIHEIDFFTDYVLVMVNAPE